MEEMSNANDYADSLKWVFDVEKRRHAMFESSNCEEIPVLL
jgi:hypothetical protein